MIVYQGQISTDAVSAIIEADDDLAAEFVGDAAQGGFIGGESAKLFRIARDVDRAHRRIVVSVDPHIVLPPEPATGDGARFGNSDLIVATVFACRRSRAPAPLT